MHDAVDLKNCDGVTLAGLTLSQNKITSYQGRIVAVGKDSDGKDYCDWKPDAGYPVPPGQDKGFLGGAVIVRNPDVHRPALILLGADGTGLQENNIQENNIIGIR